MPKEFAFFFVYFKTRWVRGEEDVHMGWAGTRVRKLQFPPSVLGNLNLSLGPSNNHAPAPLETE